MKPALSMSTAKRWKGSDGRQSIRASVASPYDVVVNAIRRELAHELTAPEELLEIPTSLPNVLQIPLSLQRPIW